MATRWGICTAGRISNDFTACLASAPKSEHQVVAVAARNLDKAKQFADHFSIPNAYGSYEELAKNPNIDVIYIGAIHTYHKSLSLLYLNNGKPVVCEKPLTMTLRDTEEVLRVAKEKNLFFLEGFWSRFFPLFEEVYKQISAGMIGDLKSIHCRINLNIFEVERLSKKELGGGGMLDIGCYPIQVTNIFFKGLPESVTSVGNVSTTGMDEFGSVILKYSNGRIATLEYHTMIEGANNSCNLMGTKGSIEVLSPFWCPTEVKIGGKIKKFPLIPVNYNINFPNSNGFHYEANAVRKCLQEGLKECPLMPHQDTLDIMTIIEEVLKQMGVSYYDM